MSKIVADLISFGLTYDIPMKSKFELSYGWALEYLLIHFIYAYNIKKISQAIITQGP